MTPKDPAYERIREALDAAEAASAAAALPHLRVVAEEVTGLIDEALASAVLYESNSLRAAGAAAGLTENAVGPRLARTRALAAYANEAGRVTAEGVRRAQYDAESLDVAALRSTASPPKTPQPMRFKPRRRTT
ncbi:MAG: hypothetical protein LCH77_16135 [Actinobacteria bacterium]|uniref:Uncharacterized protein n=1 Tax=Nostocoides veronense TaxID=330836 RepID=A0ABN2LF21_9MICO|nr:hypothetical protein [Actinomycetota bacterium]